MNDQSGFDERRTSGGGGKARGHHHHNEEGRQRWGQHRDRDRDRDRDGWRAGASGHSSSSSSSSSSAWSAADAAHYRTLGLPVGSSSTDVHAAFRAAAMEVRRGGKSNIFCRAENLKNAFCLVVVCIIKMVCGGGGRTLRWRPIRTASPRASHHHHPWTPTPLTRGSDEFARLSRRCAPSFPNRATRETMNE